MSDGDSQRGDLEVQLVTKEREWRELLAARVHQLESFLNRAHEECLSLRERHRQLRDDFQFNLAVLDERDKELERYDIITERALTVRQNRQEELHQLHMQVVQLEEQRARETEERQEELNRCQHDAAEHRLQLDELKRSSAGEIQKQTEEFERMKQDLQSRIREFEEELTLQRQEMTAAFDSELRRQEHEFNMKMDEMRAVVLSHDLKVKLLSAESEVHCQAHLQASEALEASKQRCEQIQTQLQHKEQEMRDLTAVKDCRIKELEDKLKSMETKLKKKQDNQIKKYVDVIQTLKECNEQLEAQCQAHREELQKTEKHIVRLEENMKAVAARAHHIQEEQREAMKQKDEMVHRLRTELETTRTGWDKYICQVSSEVVVKDTKILALQERESKLQTEQEKSRQEIQGYKQQLAAGLKREKALDQMRVQVELECQRRCEDINAEHYLANEQLIRELTQARDQAKAELEKKEQELKHLTASLCSSNMESDQVDPLAVKEIRRLQEQNSILRAMVTQMREDMEGLSHLIPHPDTQPQASRPQPPHQGASDQKTTGPPAHTSKISIIASPAGGLSPDKHVNTSTLVQQQLRVAPTMEQIIKNAQLREENSSFWQQQQQASGLVSEVLSDKVRGSEPVPPLLHTRLKQAALCIARLSREKQQLIEMGNRLRGHSTTAGLKERDSTVIPDRLSALEQLQYQLTTQELQFALRQRASTSTDPCLPGSNHPGPVTKGAANPWSLGHQTTDRHEKSKNKENTPPLSQSPRSLNVGPKHQLGPSRCQLSSEGSLRSLNELWEVLDHGFSPSLLSEGEGEPSRREVVESGAAVVQMMVHGSSAPIQRQPPAKIQQQRSLSKTPSGTTRTSRAGAADRTSRIRNYNIKD